jgi:PIN domain nuclease of toxin-antitoxin system
LIAYLDTNTVLWLSQGLVKRLSKRAQTVVRSADLLVSPMVLIEVEYLFEIKRIHLSSREVQRKIQHELGVRTCNLPFAEVADAALDEKWTRDAFDRVIVAHAKANGWAALVSADETIAKHYARTVW